MGVERHGFAALQRVDVPVTRVSGVAVALVGVALASATPAQSITTSGVSQADLAAAAAQNLLIMQQSVPSLAPVQSVNQQTGATTVPVFFRQVGTCTPDGNGNCTWTFPTPFSVTPTCLSDIGGSASYVYFASRSSMNSTGVTYSVSSMPKVLSLNLGAGTTNVTVWGVPPAGTSLTLSCFAPQ